MGAVTLCTALLALTSVGAGEASHQETSKARYFQLDCVLTEFNNQGQKSIRSSPSLVCREGKPVTFSHGGEVAHDLKNGRALENVEFIPYGFSATISARTMEKGKVRLDITIEDRRVFKIDETLRVKKTSLRSIETVRFAETVTLQLDRVDDSANRFGFQISVVDPNAKE